MNTKWSDIGGCKEILNSIQSNVVYPLLYLFHHADAINPLLMPPKGVLLYGPPGCGKTLLAKAIASQVHANFLNMDISILKTKWYGESEKLAQAVFTLSHKLAPSILFLDEVDSFLSQRDSSDSNTASSLKAIFLQSWDGLMTNPTSQVLILAATNRKQDIDTAILRRLPL
ncbi:hypothetical protein Pcinc_041050 [Petrolisthes cinctipes]|uniref:AAA+ ATPase domain-containing protein n=1 Tax=Petrolisthes cinctipes TaxID=88211 RepID=A0AAE1BLP1_PETCI|nr:hypothetical protein Pcinc_041050 [Petrolisthes cinctipes]